MDFRAETVVDAHTRWLALPVAAAAAAAAAAARLLLLLLLLLHACCMHTYRT